MKTNWDKNYVELAEYVAQWSKDRSTKVGAVIVKDNRVVSTGYNGFPSGFNDDVDERHSRPAKYAYTEHAERNAIYTAAKEGIGLKDSTMYLSWSPCSDCARAIIQSGISKIVVRKEHFPGKDAQWDDSIAKGLEMLLECGVEVKYID